MPSGVTVGGVPLHRNIRGNMTMGPGREPNATDAEHFIPLYMVARSKDDLVESTAVVCYCRKEAERIARIWGKGSRIALRSANSRQWWVAGIINEKNDGTLVLDVMLMQGFL